MLLEIVLAPVGSPVRCWAHVRKPTLLPPMPLNELLNALRDDIEWPVATLRLEFNHLAPLKKPCAEDPVLLGKLVELRRRLEWVGPALTDILD